jgi:hypothetical protein
LAYADFSFSRFGTELRSAPPATEVGDIYNSYIGAPRPALFVCLIIHQPTVFFS